MKQEIKQSFRILAVGLTVAACTLTGQGQETLYLPVVAGEMDRTNVILTFKKELPENLSNAKTVTLVDQHGAKYEGHIVRPEILGVEDDAKAMRWPEIHFIVPSMKKGETLNLKAETWHTEDSTTINERFHWVYDESKSAELRFADKSVLKYMHESLDESSPERREETYKVFHHLFDPSGQILITKGAGGKYTHHRGLFYGFNKITYDGDKECDVWHCKGKAHQAHRKFLYTIESPYVGEHMVNIIWHGVAGEAIASELRTVRVFNYPNGLLTEFRSILFPIITPLHLDGDPQHAGFHFRAAQEVAESTSKETYFLRPDGKGQPGETRNWPDQPNHINLPWNGMSFVVGGKRYTALYIDTPKNPKEARFSERDYGRFGSYFSCTLGNNPPEKELLFVRYGIWLQEGEMTVEDANTISAAFVDPPHGTSEWK